MATRCRTYGGIVLGYLTDLSTILGGPTRDSLRTSCVRRYRAKFENAPTVGSQIRYWNKRFEKEGISEPTSSIRYLIAHVLGTKKMYEVTRGEDTILTEEQIDELTRCCELRLQSMPVQYIIGEWDFRELTLKVKPPVLIPRPETEVLVDLVLRRLNHVKGDHCKLLEIGSGSGAVSLSILYAHKTVEIVAIDKNAQACELTLENARNLNLLDRLTVLNASLEESGDIRIKKKYKEGASVDLENDKVDLIVSNPPYVPSDRMSALQPEIKYYEDSSALDGGPDGLNLIRPIIAYASRALGVGGHLILEIDSSHAREIESLVKERHATELRFLGITRDYCGRNRYAEIKKIRPA